MPVSELLDKVGSPELSEWIAFEQAFGPLGNQWRDETLAKIHDQLQVLNHMFALTNFEGEPDEPERLPRPQEIYQHDEED